MSEVGSVKVECRLTVSDETAASAVVLLNMYLSEGGCRAYVWDLPEGGQHVEVKRLVRDE